MPKVTLRFEPGQSYECHACRALGKADSEGIVIHNCIMPHPVVYPKLFNKSFSMPPDPKTAKRELTRPRYDLIPKEWLDWLASIFEEGAVKYGERNWQDGDQQFAKDCLNHAMDHLLRHNRGDSDEAHLGKVAWNALAALSLGEHPHGF